MAKIKSVYICTKCGYQTSRWLGKCPECSSWDTLEEQFIEAKNTAATAAVRLQKPLPLNSEIVFSESRVSSGMSELDQVLGGGIVSGSLVLIGGDPGIGKSTLMLQVALKLARKVSVLYVSGEESERQIKMRSMRLLGSSRQRTGAAEQANYFPDNLYLVTETRLDVILNHINEVKPDLLIIDSVQTTYLQELDSLAGSVTQIRETASRLREVAKSTGLTVFLIGHVTKEGIIAGPKVLEHIVDTVLYLEGDRFQAYRLLRSSKNRFGATSEVGVFEMQEQGMIEVANPSEAFLAERMVNAPGSAIAVTMEGTRPLLVEVQGLTSPTSFGNPRRTPNGIDFNRLLLTVAVLTRRAGVKLSDQDVFVNVIGGLSVREPAIDLAAAAAIASSVRNSPVRADAVLIGEVGLSGELRTVGRMAERLKEAANLGFKQAIIPRRLRREPQLKVDLKIVEARSLREALRLALLNESAED